MGTTQDPKKSTHDPEKMLKEMTSELAKINKELDKTRDGGKKRGVKELESGGITIILEALARTMDLAKSMLAKGPEENCPRVRVLEEKTRVLEDSSDAHHQRSEVTERKVYDFIKKGKQHYLLRDQAEGGGGFCSGSWACESPRRRLSLATTRPLA